MKMKRWLFAATAICCILTSGCKSNVIENEPTPPDKETTGNDVSLSLRIMQNNYTRASTEDEISSLLLAFYKIEGTKSNFLYAKDAKKAENEEFYSVILNSAKETPNAVVALANLQESIELKEILNTPILYGNLVLADGKYIMSNAGYYNTNSLTNDYFRYATISESNFNGDPVDIHLDRIGVKVTVTKDADISCGSLNALSIDDAERSFNLSLTSWGVLATDKKTSLLKDNGSKSYSEMAAILGDIETSSDIWVWNDPAAHSFSWAFSENYQKTGNDFPAPGKESESSITTHLKFDEITNSFGASGIYHETTRPATLFATPNARPSVVLIGQYTLEGETAPQTLFRKGNVVITLEEMAKHIADRIKGKELLFANGKPYDESSLATSLRISGPVFMTSIDDNNMPNIVTAQINKDYIKNDTDGHNISDNEGKRLLNDEVDDVNKQLAELVGEWEIFEDGYCFFTIPINHARNRFDADNTMTGSFGMVRNHHYNITVKSISGSGIGVKKDALLGEWPCQYASGNVMFSIGVNPWTNVNQEINFSN